MNWPNMYSYLKMGTYSAEQLNVWAGYGGSILGKNWVGKVLMQLREEYKEAEARAEAEAEAEEAAKELEDAEMADELDSSSKSENLATHLNKLRAVPIGGIYAFFKYSELSDFHTADFILDGVKYNSVMEFQYTSMLKAMGLWNDRLQLFTAPNVFFKTARKIEQDALKAKYVTRQEIRNWGEANLFSVLLRANRAKFAAHPELHQALLDTGRKVILFSHPFQKEAGIGKDPEQFEEWRRREALNDWDIWQVIRADFAKNFLLGQRKWREMGRGRRSSGLGGFKP